MALLNVATNIALSVPPIKQRKIAISLAVVLDNQLNDLASKALRSAASAMIDVRWQSKLRLSLKLRGRALY